MWERVQKILGGKGDYCCIALFGSLTPALIGTLWMFCSFFFCFFSLARGAGGCNGVASLCRFV